jgi:hypothetical protein
MVSLESQRGHSALLVHLLSNDFKHGNMSSERLDVWKMCVPNGTMNQNGSNAQLLSAAPRDSSPTLPGTMCISYSYGTQGSEVTP